MGRNLDGVLSVRFPRIDRLRAMAEADGMTVSAWIRHQAELEIGRREAKEAEPPGDAPVAEPIQRMDIRDFREAGYLQEANRRFFHPLGLALETVRDADGNEVLGGVWDYRDDPVGMAFGPDLVLALPMAERARRVEAEVEAKAAARTALFGSVVQPIDPDPDMAVVSHPLPTESDHGEA